MTRRSAGCVAPSKTAREENFPVGSWLLPSELRPHVARFYRVVRAADDIADAPELTAEEKIAALDEVDATLGGASPVNAGCEAAARLRAELSEIDVSVGHARDVLKAFKQDASKRRYRDWEDLLEYCRYSANPVGRFLLDLHGEASAGRSTSHVIPGPVEIRPE